MRAVEGFDPKVGTRFSTYASYWIKQNIRAAIRDLGRPIRIPAYLQDLMKKFDDTCRAIQERAEAKGKAIPTGDQLRKLAYRALELSEGKIASLERAQRVRALKPRDPVDPEFGSAVEELKDERKPIELDAEDRETLERLREQLDSMDKREADVIRWRFGLNDVPPKTLKEIGEILGLTRERVRQIENQALGKLTGTMVERDE